jgi:hypothetical protein
MSFSGPLFLIGYGRSGTKLLRSILNNHSHIGIVDIETNFLPKWISEWEAFGNLKVPDTFHRFYRIVCKDPFFYYMRKRGDLINEKIWFSACKKYDVASVFEALIKYYMPNKKIWGDKSPNNTKHISVIKEIYPQAKFIHIVRDVRDCCLSANKAWKSNIYRCAQRWDDTLLEFNNQIKHMNADDIFIIKYENLLENPIERISCMCKFLEIQFENEMLKINKFTENVGGAAGKKKIIGSNKDKYLEKMSGKQIHRIEKIAINSIKKLNYEHTYEGPQKKVPKLLMIIFRLRDGFNHLLRNSKEMGLCSSINFIYKFFYSNIRYNKN